MNFNELYEKYKAGAADEQERAFVEGEIEKARRIHILLEENGAKSVELGEADSETVKKAQRAFTLRSTVRTAVIAVICIVVIAAIGLGGVFGTACISANNAIAVGEEEAVEIAKGLLAQQLGELPTVIIEKVETELDMGSKLTNSVMVYEIWIGVEAEHYCIRVSAKTGYALLADKRVDKVKDQIEHEESKEKK